MSFFFLFLLFFCFYIERGVGWGGGLSIDVFNTV